MTNRQMNLGGSVEGSFSTSPVLTFLKLISLLLNFHKKSIVLETFKIVLFSKSCVSSLAPLMFNGDIMSIIKADF